MSESLPLPTPDETEHLKQKLRDVLKNPQLIAKTLESLKKKKPDNWGRRSVSSYYNEKCGQWIKFYLQEMLDDPDKTPIIFGYKEAVKILGLNHESLYQKINMSMRYLCDRLDDEAHTFGRLCQMLKVRRDRWQGGVTISVRDEFLQSHILDFKPRRFINKKIEQDWKMEIRAFIKDGPVGEPKQFGKLSLTLEEMDLLKQELNIRGIVSNIKTHTVIILKTSEYGH